MKKMYIITIAILLSFLFVGCDDTDTQNLENQCNGEENCYLLEDNQIDSLLTEKGIENGKMTNVELEAVNSFVQGFVLNTSAIQYYASNTVTIQEDGVDVSDFYCPEGNFLNYARMFVDNSVVDTWDNYYEFINFQKNIVNFEVDELCNQQKQYITVDGTVHDIYRTGDNQYLYEYGSGEGYYMYQIDLNNQTIDGNSINEAALLDYINQVNALDVCNPFGSSTKELNSIDAEIVYLDDVVYRISRTFEDQSDGQYISNQGRIDFLYYSESLYIELIVSNNLSSDGSSLYESGNITFTTYINNNNVLDRKDFSNESSIDIASNTTYQEFIQKVTDNFSDTTEKQLIEAALAYLTEDEYNTYIKDMQDHFQ